jgi:hypothetical protein
MCWVPWPSSTMKQAAFSRSWPTPARGLHSAVPTRSVGHRSVGAGLVSRFEAHRLAHSRPQGRRPGAPLELQRAELACGLPGRRVGIGSSCDQVVSKRTVASSLTARTAGCPGMTTRGAAWSRYAQRTARAPTRDGSSSIEPRPDQSGLSNVAEGWRRCTASPSHQPSA